jgi:hypothetical protein
MGRSIPPLVVELVGLAHAWLEVALLEAKIVVRIASIGLLSLGDERPDRVRVPLFIEGLVVRRLEVVVNHAALFLLA